MHETKQNMLQTGTHLLGLAVLETPPFTCTSSSQSPLIYTDFIVVEGAWN